MFSSGDGNGAVASNEDGAIELTMYRQSGSPSGEASESGDQGLVQPFPDGLGSAERGEVRRRVQPLTNMNLLH